MRPAEFFETLYPTAPDGAWLTIWTLPDKLTRFFPATKEGFVEAEREGLRLADEGKNVYFGVGLRKEKLSPEKRGEFADIIAIPGFWADVDVREGEHKEREKYPPREEALETLMTLPVPPTVLVDSGGGLHAYWLLHEPWALPDGAGIRDFFRQEASFRVDRFQKALRALWEERGWKLDNTADLPRVLRVPGTRNWKNPEKPRVVKVVHASGRRYALEELDRWAEGVLAARQRKAAPAPETEKAATVDAEAVVELVKAWWTQGDRHNRALALAGFLAKRGVPEEVAVNIISRIAENDEELKDRIRAIKDSYRKLAAGQAVAGLSALPAELAEKLNSLVRRPDPVAGILNDLGDPPEWPRLFERDFLRRLAGLQDADLQRFLAELRARGGAKVVSPSKLEKAVVRARARARAEERGLEVLPGGGDPSAVGKRYIADRFPPAKDIIPQDFPFPETGEKRTYFDIRSGKVVKVAVRHDEDGEREEVSPVVDTVVLLVRRVDPVERDAGIEKFSVAWWERDRWRFADVPARFLFDRKKVGELIDIGLPVSSANVDALIGWLHGLRALAVLGHQEAPELPTVRAVSRCGWHELDGERFFVVGREILRPGEAAAADAGDREEIQPDADERTDADVRWAEDLSAMERQILTSFRCGGDPEEHKRFLLEAALKYPQVAFGLGCAAGAPLLRFARAAGLIDVEGFCVLMLPRAGGRSRHQGKSTWNAVVASLFGWPGSGPEGRLRHADATRVARGVLFATNCDLTIHLEELQHLARASKKQAAEELTVLIHQVSSGMDRERGARGGGGRRTRGFHVVLFGTAEVDVTAKLPPESGAHDRVLKLPPLLPEETDQNRDESERLMRLAMEHHGHAGREYLAWLAQKVQEEGDSFIREGVADALEELRRDLPVDARRASAGRLASRAAVGLCGLTLLLESWGVEDPATVDAAVESFLRGWEMVVDAIPAETVADRALEAVQAFVAANKELIDGLRDPGAKNPPQRWHGVLTEVTDDAGQKVQVVALTEPAFTEAVEREPFNLDSHHALQALAAVGHVVTRTEKKPDGRTAMRTKLRVRVAGVRTFCVCVPAALLDIQHQQGTIPASAGDDGDDIDF